jgi:hypothetical protein
MELIRRYLFLITVLSLLAFMAHGQRSYPSHQRNSREVRIRMKYQQEGRPNKITANGPGLFFALDCVALSPGIAYERFLDANGLLSVSLPVYGFIGSSFYLGGARSGDISTEISGLYAQPALMLHPIGNAHRVDFSAGPGLAIGSLHRKDREVGINNSLKKQFQRTDNLYALMGELDMTINTPSAFVFGLHLGVGSILESGLTEGAIVNLGFKLGGRF